MLKQQNNRWKFRFLGMAFVAVFSFLSMAFIPPKPVSADPGEPGPYNRALNYGFFFNQRFTSGDDVIPGGIYSSNIDQFINDVRSRAQNIGGGWSLQNIRGAEFIIQTMRNQPPQNTFPTLAEINDWEARVRSLVANGGWINFNAAISFNVNSYWQQPGDDDAFFTINHGAYIWHPWDFYDGFLVGNSIAFYDSGGNQLYAIRQRCGNPLGNSSGLPPAVPYNLTPAVNASVTGAPPGATTAEPGDTINFDFRVNSSTGTPSPVVNCTITNTNRAGYYGVVVGGPGVPTGCPRSFPGNASTQVATQSVIAVANTTVCRRLTVTPATSAGATRTTETCIAVVSRPYLKVFGGDVRTGGGVETAADVCTTDNNASINAWNRNTPGYFGAGVQYAQYATGAIMGFGSSQNTAPGTPTGLSFASTTQNLASGKYGGNFGSAKCIPDYFGQKPATTSPISDLATVNKGAFSAVGNTTLAGLNLTAGKNWVIYIDGDLQINNDIVYSGTWAYKDVPMLQVVVRGSIFIAPGVQNLAGTFIAQPRANGTGGTIYTCASSMTIPAITNGAFAASCGNRLTVNGSFVAKDIEFLRVRGTLNNSAAGETNGTTSAAEVFNYGPAFWVSQPYIRGINGGEIDKYDAITSLPPVL